MATATVRDFTYLKDFGFSDQQVEGLSQVIQQREENLLQVAKQKTDQLGKKVVTREYLDLQVENIKKSLVIQTIGVVFSGMVLLGWFINYLDNKTSDYVQARFDSQEAHFKTRFDNQDARFDSQDARFDKIESDLKDIKNFIFSLSTSKTIKQAKEND